MKITILPLLFVSLPAMIEALILPLQVNPLNWHTIDTQDLTKRNDTVGTQQLDLNIDPDIVNPVCGNVFLANINVESAPDPFYLSTDCNKVLNFIGGPKGNKDVDVVFTCPGQPNNGTGDRDVKVILSTLANNPVDSGTQDIAANMQLEDADDDDFIVSVGVQLGVKVDASKTTFQYIFC
jgi:hypothetical protein